MADPDPMQANVRDSSEEPEPSALPSPIPEPELEPAESTPELLARAQRGDPAALDALGERCLPRLQRWTRNRLPQQEQRIDIQALVEDTFVHCVRHSDSFSPGWDGALYASLRRAILNRLADELRKLEVDEETTRTFEATGVLPGSALHELVGRAELEHYETALANLPEADRAFIVARVEMGCSYVELAQALDEPSSDATRLAVKQALRRLAKEMSRAS